MEYAEIQTALRPFALNGWYAAEDDRDGRSTLNLDVHTSNYQWATQLALIAATVGITKRKTPRVLLTEKGVEITIRSQAGVTHEDVVYVAAFEYERNLHENDGFIPCSTGACGRE